MRLVQDPRHPTRGDSSISVGGKEYPISDGVIENVPDHLAKELKDHGFIDEGQYLMYQAQEAEKDHKRLEQEQRDEETRKSIHEQHLKGIADEEKIRVQARFAEEDRIRAMRKNDGGSFVNTPPMTEDPNLKISPDGNPMPLGGVHSPRRSVTMSVKSGGSNA